MALLVNLKKFLNTKSETSMKEEKLEDKGEFSAAQNRDDVKTAVASVERAERIAALTPREKQLLALLLEGCTLQQSADKLSIRYPTANTHITSIYRKLGVSSRAELIIKYRQQNG